MADRAEQPLGGVARPAAGGGPARGSGPRRRAAARSTPGNSTVFSGNIGSVVAHTANVSPGGRLRLLPRWSPRGGVPAAAPRIGTMIRRIDLRGATAPVDYRAAVPRAELRRRGRAARRCGRSARPSATAGSTAILEFSARFDGVEQADIARAAGGARARPWRELDPAVRAGLEESIRRLRLTCEAELEHDVDDRGGARRHGDPPQGAGRPGRPLRPRRPRARWSPAS